MNLNDCKDAAIGELNRENLELRKQRDELYIALVHVQNCYRTGAGIINEHLSNDVNCLLLTIKHDTESKFDKFIENEIDRLNEDKRGL